MTAVRNGRVRSKLVRGDPSLVNFGWSVLEVYCEKNSKMYEIWCFDDRGLNIACGRKH